jgi:hypothetical protein
MPKLLKTIPFKYTSESGKKFDARITGVYNSTVGPKQETVKYITFDIFYNENLGWKEVKSSKIQKEQYIKQKSKI